MAHRIETIEINGNPMEVFIFEPQGAGPHPGIMQCMHIPVGHTGIENDSFTLKSAQRYADNGYVVAVPFVFHWWPKSAGIEIKRDEFRDDWTIPDLNAAYDLLSGLDNVDAERIGIVGHCWGGRVSWVGAGSNPRYTACAVFYGGRVKLVMGEGNEDQNPSPEDVDDYSEALSKAGVEHTFHRYDRAGHAFQSFNSEEHYRHTASEDAWAKVLDFFAEKLK